MTEIDRDDRAPEAAERVKMLTRDADMARRNMVRLREVFELKVSELEGSDLAGIKTDDVMRVSKDLSRAITTAFELEGRLQDARRIEQGGGGLDLAGARAEVRRRLDRILAGRDAGEVPR